MVAEAVNLQFDYSRYGFRQEERYVYKAPKGLNERIVRELSGMKGEPEWMLKRRLRARDFQQEADAAGRHVGQPRTGRAELR